MAKQGGDWWRRRQGRTDNGNRSTSLFLEPAARNRFQQRSVRAKLLPLPSPVTDTHRFPVLYLALVTKLQIIDAVAIKEKYADDDDGYVVGGENIYM